MLLAEKIDWTSYTEPLPIVEAFKMYQQYLKKAASTIFFKNNNNLNKFIETTFLKDGQILWTQNLLGYDFKIDHNPRIKISADLLS